MWRFLAVAALVMVASCSGRGVSGPIGSACLSSGRSSASPVLCSCIQGVADQSLSGSDQRQAAKFFDDPDEAQETRTSDNPSTEAFWRRYRAFSDAASATCG